MEDIQQLSLDTYCSDDIIDHLYDDMAIQRNQKLENLLEHISSRKSEAKQNKFILELSVKVINDRLAVTDVSFAVNAKFNFSREDVNNLAQLIWQDHKALYCLEQYVNIFEFNEAVDKSGYPFYAFIFATLMLRKKEMYHLHGLTKTSSSHLQEKAYEVYSLVQELILNPY